MVPGIDKCGKRQTARRSVETAAAGQHTCETRCHLNSSRVPRGARVGSTVSGARRYPTMTRIDLDKLDKAADCGFGRSRIGDVGKRTELEAHAAQRMIRASFGLPRPRSNGKTGGRLQRYAVHISEIFERLMIHVTSGRHVDHSVRIIGALRGIVLDCVSAAWATRAYKDRHDRDEDALRSPERSGEASDGAVRCSALSLDTPGPLAWIVLLPAPATGARSRCPSGLNRKCPFPSENGRYELIPEIR